MAKIGRPSKYKKKYCKEMIEYFDIPATFVDSDGKEKANDLPTIAGFAHSIGTTVRQSIIGRKNILIFLMHIKKQSSYKRKSGSKTASGAYIIRHSLYFLVRMSLVGLTSERPLIRLPLRIGSSKLHLMTQSK